MRLNSFNKLNVPLLVIITLIVSFSILEATSTAEWSVINFKQHGTRRLVSIEDNKWYFYRTELNQSLVLETEGGTILIKTVVRNDKEKLTYQVKIGNAYRNFTVVRIGQTGDFGIFEDIMINLAEGSQKIEISSNERTAYFKVFRKKEIQSVKMVNKEFTPNVYDKSYTLVTDKTQNHYYSATKEQPLEFTVKGVNEITGFYRCIDNETAASFDILVNDNVIDSKTVAAKKTGTYSLAEDPGKKLSLGKKIAFSLPEGDYRVVFQPRNNGEFIFRLFMDFPEEVVEREELTPEYEQSSFKKPSVFENITSKLDVGVGLSVGYTDNVFTLSEYDLGRFEKGNPIFSFIETSDDLIISPSINVKYPVSFKQLTVAPYLNLKYYHYLNNSDKDKYSSFAGLLNSYKDFNINMYYGYYPGNYVRDYKDKDGTGEYEQYTYDKNLYRLYSYYKLTEKDIPYLYLQVEDYFFNEYFTEYDGRATTIGVGWKHDFLSFYLKLFYYYRKFDTSNVHYDISQISPSDRITDPKYESNIYDIEYQNKKLSLYRGTKFRPFFGLRFEERFYTTDLPVQVSPYQSTRAENRYKISLGSEFFLTNDLSATLNYTHNLRDVSSDYSNLMKYKNYKQNTIKLDFNYKIKF